MNFRRFAVLVGGVGFLVALLSLVSCGDSKQRYATGARVEIAPPDSAEVWAHEVVRCLGRGSWPAGVKWYAARLAPPTVGYADHAEVSITLDSVVLGWAGTELYEKIVRHEETHLIGGWKANHPGVPPTGRVDEREPRGWFQERCGNVP